MGAAESKPWREISQLNDPASWNADLEKKYRATCLDGPVDARRLGSHQVKILMFGATQNGKSSLVNSLLCAMTGTINQYVIAGTSEHSLTRSLYSPDVRVDGQRLKFKLTDMPGFFRGMGEYAEDYLNAVLGGHIKEDSIVPEGPLDQSADYFIQKPQPFDLPCCVVLVMRAGKPLDEDIKRKFQLVIQAAERVRLKVAVVLTHVDNLEDRSGQKVNRKTVSLMFYSEAVHAAVRDASNETGIPMAFIHPVVNYTEEVETVTEMNILHLYTLSKMLALAGEGANARCR